MFHDDKCFVENRRGEFSGETFLAGNFHNWVIFWGGIFHRGKNFLKGDFSQRFFWGENFGGGNFWREFFGGSFPNVT